MREEERTRKRKKEKKEEEKGNPDERRGENQKKKERKKEEEKVDRGEMRKTHLVVGFAFLMESGEKKCSYWLWVEAIVEFCFSCQWVMLIVWFACGFW